MPEPIEIIPPESEYGAWLRRMRELWTYAAERFAASGHAIEDIPALVERALANLDPVALAQAKGIVAKHFGGRPRRVERERTGEDDRLDEVWAEVLAEWDEEKRRVSRGERV